MSEPMSSIEIEDVLSSIRRLVSEDLRPAPREVSVMPVIDSRLILTPSLRVVPTASEPAWEDEGAWVDEPLAPMGWSAPAAEPQASAAPPHRFTLSNSASTLDDVEDEVEDPSWARLPMPPMQPLTLTPDLAVVTSAPPPPPAEPADGNELAGAVETIPAAPDWTADLGEDDEGWADRAAAEAIAGIEAEQQIETSVVVPFAEEPEVETATEDDTGVTYDEDLLRDLVRDLIREELAGGLGEKITRSVRKLVRAEIAQALATRSMD